MIAASLQIFEDAKSESVPRRPFFKYWGAPVAICVHWCYSSSEHDFLNLSAAFTQPPCCFNTIVSLSDQIEIRRYPPPFVATDIHSLTFSQQLKMLDTFEILTTSGVVLWSKSYTPISPSIINGLITNVFIEERTLPGAGIADDISAANNPPYKHEQHTLKWTTVKELGLIFVVSWNPAEAQSTLTMNGIC